MAKSEENTEIRGKKNEDNAEETDGGEWTSPVYQTEPPSMYLFVEIS